MALSIIEAANNGLKSLDKAAKRGNAPIAPHYTRLLLMFCVHSYPDLTSSELSLFLTPFDIKRLDSYSNNMLDYHVILDLLPTVASWYFEKRLGEEVQLSGLQSSILLALGLQRKAVEEVEVSFSEFYVSSEIDYRGLTIIVFVVILG
jgi:N-acetyltransferase 10